LEKGGTCYRLFLCSKNEKNQKRYFLGKDLEMVHIEMTIKGVVLDFELAGKLAEDVVGQIIDEPMMLCWSDKQRSLHSPSGVHCEIKGEPGWEVYGRNHGGQYRISINSDEYVFIFC
jgi:hypothetical protein